MKVVVIGATGFVGKNIVNELVARNHDVIGISRQGSDLTNTHFTNVLANVTDIDALVSSIKGSDIVVSAFSSGWSNPNFYADFIQGSKAIEEAVKKAGVPRYLVIGGAGSLYVAEGVQAVDTADFPKEYYPVAIAARDYLTILATETQLDWTMFSPAFEMHPGITTGRTGKYRLGTDYPVLNDEQRSILSVEDLAVVIADEVEQAKHHKCRFTAAY